MKKGLIIALAAIVLVGGGAGGYLTYQKKAEQKEYESQMAATISSLPTITMYEKEDLPTVEEEFQGTDKMINIDSVQPDISNVYATEPGEYEVKYTFNDTKGEQRTATVKCEVKPELASHVTGMKNITIDKGDELPTDSECTFDDYVDSVTLNTEDVDTEEAGTYDISYTILGADGEMKTVDGYTCTVNEVAPPTPTPSPSPTPSPTPEPKSEEPEEATPAADTEADSEQNQNTQDGEAVGNVEVQNNVVETGDENNIIAIIAVIVVCLGAARR